MPDEQIEGEIPIEKAIFIDFLDYDLNRLQKRINIRKQTANLISIHEVTELANHRMVSSVHPIGRKCDQTLNGPGFVCVWAQK